KKIKELAVEREILGQKKLNYNEMNAQMEEILIEKDVLGQGMLNYNRLSKRMEERTAMEKEIQEQEKLDRNKANAQMKEKEMKNIYHSIRRLENSIYLLKCKHAQLQSYTDSKLLDSLKKLNCIAPGQQQYLLKKIKEFEKSLNIKLIRNKTDEPEEAEKMEVDEPAEQHQTLDMSDETESSSVGASARTSTLGKVLAGGLLVLGSMAYVKQHLKSKPTTAANSDNDSLYHVMDSRQLRNMDKHNIS
ncbi:hypothetical protein NEMIN01_2410, partial [Nematocida minor]|uniref:uncharacterized protein n=1 Tax=Nematocida minor TaxID=1912983 RepID=UPI00221EEEF7